MIFLEDLFMKPLMILYLRKGVPEFIEMLNNNF